MFAALLSFLFNIAWAEVPPTSRLQVQWNLTSKKLVHHLYTCSRKRINMKRSDISICSVHTARQQIVTNRPKQNLSVCRHRITWAGRRGAEGWLMSVLHSLLWCQEKYLFYWHYICFQTDTKCINWLFCCYSRNSMWLYSVVYSESTLDCWPHTHTHTHTVRKETKRLKSTVWYLSHP